MRFRRALDRGNVTEALSAASELQFVGLAEALDLTCYSRNGKDEVGIVVLVLELGFVVRALAFSLPSPEKDGGRSR